MPLWLIFLSASAFAQGNATKELPEKINPAALLNDIVGRAPKEMTESVGVLKIRHADDSITRIPIKWTIRPGTNEWFDAYQTPANGPIPSEVLVVTHREGQPNQYELRRGNEIVPDAATNVFLPFATSDFWVCDFGLEFLHWPNPSQVKTEMRKGRACYVIETRSPHPQAGQYAKVLSWIDTETGGLIRAEAYDTRNKLLKEFAVGDIKKINGRWQIKKLVLRNDQTDTNTDLEFNLEVADK